MDEDRGLGRNILKALGQRDKDDDFEDAVNYANEGKNSAVLRYVRTAINKTLKEKGVKDPLGYLPWTEMMETLADSFKKWSEKKPNRYKAFFSIVYDEIKRRQNIFQSYQKNLSRIDLPNNIKSMNWQSQ